MRTKTFFLAAISALFLTSPVFCGEADMEKIIPSVFRIYCFTDNGYGSGSGFIVEITPEAGYVATNSHVVNGANELLLLRKVDDIIECFKGEIFWEDEEKDLAIVKVPNLTGTPLPLSSPQPARGSDTYALGFPGRADGVDDESREATLHFLDRASQSKGSIVSDPTGHGSRLLELTVSKGGVRRATLNKWDSNHKTQPFMIIEHDVNILPGNSGGPLVNACGQVVGVNTAAFFDLHERAGIMGSIRVASHAGALADEMRKLRLNPIVILEPCVLKPAGLPKAVQNMFAASVGVAVLALGLALYLSIRKPAYIIETYSQFLGRKKKTTASPSESRQMASQDSVVTPARATTPVSWVLEGINPEAQGNPNIALKFTFDEAQRHGGKILLGRKKEFVHLVVKNTSVSGQHAAFIFDGQGNIQLEDKNSSNGTKVNGSRLVPFKPVSVATGDKIQIGEVNLHLRKQ